MRYRFKGIVRSTGQFVEGHAHGETPDEAYNALSEHGIVTEGLVPDPEAINLNAASQPFSSAIDSALDTAASQVPFDALADKFKGKQVWVLDRDKIRKRVSQVVDQALGQAIENAGGGAGLNAMDVRHQVADAISGLFKDNKNLTSQVSGSTQALDGQLKRLEAFLGRAESLLAQMTVAISRIGSGGGGGGGGGGRRGVSKAGGGEQNTVLLEIFKENLKLRGISIDEPAGGDAAAAGAAMDTGGAATAVAEAPPDTAVATAEHGGDADLPPENRDA